MMNQPPEQLRNAAIVQIVGGVIDLLIGWFLASCVWSIGGTLVGTVLTVCTLGMCPVGMLCSFGGFFGFLIIPLGILEIISGVVGLTSPQSAGTLMRITAALGVAGLLLGSVTSLVSGATVLMMMRSADVRGYL